jgi:hypothetical protein
VTRRRTMDKLDPPTTYQRIIERGPWASYARCDECGVDAGKACRDDNDCVALEVCDGRRLAINDSAARTRAPLKYDTDVVSCVHCHRVVDRSSRPLSRRAWCNDPDCQAAKQIRKLEAQRKRRRAQAKVLALCGEKIDRQCLVCGTEFVAAVVNQIYCGPACKGVAKRRQRKTVTTRTSR